MRVECKRSGYKRACAVTLDHGRNVLVGSDELNRGGDTSLRLRDELRQCGTCDVKRPQHRGRSSETVGLAALRIMKVFRKRFFQCEPYERAKSFIRPELPAGPDITHLRLSRMTTADLYRCSVSSALRLVRSTLPSPLCGPATRSSSEEILTQSMCQRQPVLAAARIDKSLT